MANRNTNPGIGKVADSGVMNNPSASRAHTRTRGMSYEDINNIPLSCHTTRMCARTRGERQTALGSGARPMAHEYLRRRFRPRPRGGR